MRENIMDAVTDGIKERMDWLRQSLAEQFKNTKKFRREPVPRSELLRHYQAMTADDLMDFLTSQTGFYQQRQQDLLTQFPESQPELRPPEELAREDLNEFLFEMKKMSGDRRLKRED